MWAGIFKKFKEVPFSQDDESTKYDPNLIKLSLEAKFLKKYFMQTINKYMYMCYYMGFRLLSNRRRELCTFYKFGHNS